MHCALFVYMIIHLLSYFNKAIPNFLFFLVILPVDSLRLVACCLSRLDFVRLLTATQLPSHALRAFDVRWRRMFVSPRKRGRLPAARSLHKKTRT